MRWSNAEDQILRTYFPYFGAEWDGWPEVLPGRSSDAIRGRAKRTALTMSKRSYEYPKGADQATVLLQCGFTTSEIDRYMGLKPGQAREMISNAWLRDKERYDRIIQQCP